MPGGRWIAAASIAVALLAPRPARAHDEPEADPPPILEPIRVFPFLDDEDPTATVSVGDASHGWLANGKQLVESPEIGVLPRQRARDLAYGTAEMIALLGHAAATLHEKTKTRLWIGDISRRGGGDIVWSVSHNSGRDADIALAYVGPDGLPADPPDLVRVDARGESKDKTLRFDVARTWTIVRALLEFKGADVQFLFLANPLKRKLLEHANLRKESPAIIARARDVILQPGAPHDDHLHVRIHCAARDLGGGCVETGVTRPWARVDPAARPGRVAAAVLRLDASDELSRRNAVERLALLGAREHAEAIAARLRDPSPVVRAVAASALGAFGGPDHEPALVTSYYVEHDLPTRLAILEALGQTAGSAAGRLFASVIGDAPLFCDDIEIPPVADLTPVDGELLFSPPPPSPLLLSAPCSDRGERSALLSAAVLSAASADRLEPVPALLDELSRGAADQRARAADALSRITNRRFGETWDDTVPSPDRDRWIAGWRKYADTLGKAPRELWVASGFLAANVHAPRLDTAHAWELVSVLPRKDHLAFNAHRALVKMTGRTAIWFRWDDASACDDWSGFLITHRAKLHAPAPPKNFAACKRVRD